jgi:hypothetical protein
MGAKKKKGDGGKKKGGKGDDDEDTSVVNFWRAYRKKCGELDCEVSKIIKEYYNKFDEDDEIPKKFHLWEELGWPGVKAIVESLKSVA